MLRVLMALWSSFLGVMITLPDQRQNGYLTFFQIGANELGWTSALAGAGATLLGLRRGKFSRVTTAMGLLGFGLSVRPYLAWFTAKEDMDAAFRAGLGEDFLATIPAAMQQRITAQRFSLSNTMLWERDRLLPAVRMSRDVTFATVNGLDLKLDVYEPLSRPPIGERYPIIISVHGGAWQGGNKGEWYARNHHYLTHLGYVLFDVNYRLSGTAIWPAALEDLQTALAWVKAHAADYQADADNIILYGRSAGAHLCCMVAAKLAADDHSVRGVVGINTPTDLRWRDMESQSPVVAFMGGHYEDIPEVYASASPVEQVGEHFPPTLLVEGGRDSIVTHVHGDRMANRLSLTQTPFALLRIPWSRHGFDGVLGSVGGQLAQYYIDRFMAWCVYRNERETAV